MEEEHFAGNCSSICDNPAISNELKTICDTGSQQYCTTGSNIYKPECKAYLTRVVGNAAADKTGKTYANPIRIPVSTDKSIPTQTAKDYYNALSLTMKSLPRDGASLTSTNTADLVKILKANDPADYGSNPFYLKLTDDAFKYCATDANPNAAFCSETATDKSWIALEFDNINKFFSMGLTNRQTIWTEFVKTQIIPKLNDYKLMFTRMPNTFKPLADLILGVLTKDDLIDPDLIKLRSLSPYIQSGVDTFVINLINAPKSGFARERLAGDAPMYNVALTNNDNLYGTNFRTFLANLQKFNTDNKILSDPLITLVNTTDNANITTCSTGNPLANPMCAQVATVTSSANATNILNATVAFCSDAKNVKDPKCIDHINGNQTIYNLNDVNTKMLNYCLTTDGQNDTNCKPFSTLTGSDQWLLNATKNTTDAAGVTTTVCGTAGNLSKDVCQSVCTTYPSVCAADTQTKCSTGANRYSTNVDFFEGGNKENLDHPKNGSWEDWLVFIFWIIIYVIAAAAALAVGAAGFFAIGNWFGHRKFNGSIDTIG